MEYEAKLIQKYIEIKIRLANCDLEIEPSKESEYETLHITGYVKGFPNGLHFKNLDEVDNFTMGYEIAFKQR